MAVVVVQQSGDVALLVVFYREPGPDAAQRIEERVRCLRLHLCHFAVGIFFIERLSLAEQRRRKVTVRVSVLAGNAVQNAAAAA